MTATMERSTTHVPSRWTRRIVLVGFVWTGIIVALMLVEPVPEDRVIGLSIAASGLYGWAFWLTRNRWLPRLSGHPLRNAIWLGSINAAVIETLFLSFGWLLGAEGVGAHPNLVIDLLLTMPWYIGMVVIFVRMQHRRRFSLWVVLLLGGLYEVGADGIIGAIPSGSLVSPVYWLLLPLVAFWMFVPVYSSMVLPPALLVGTTPAPSPPAVPAWRDAIRPLWWLVPFFVYLVAAMLVLMGLDIA
ncbi:MAG: hypothetical protein ACC683_03965 [Acidimicrobiia bacterium]